jgi:hypothetical protein
LFFFFSFSHAIGKEFKILFVGDSHINVNGLEGSAGWEGYPTAFPNILGNILNYRESLENKEPKYVTKMLWIEATYSPLIWPIQSTVNLAKEYNILFWVISPGTLGGDYSILLDWFKKPITEEGIPLGKLESEYLLKNITVRTTGVAKRFMARSIKLKLGSITNNTFKLGDIKKTLDDKPLRDMVIEMVSKPLTMCKEIAGTNMYLLLLPKAGDNTCDYQISFWEEIAKKVGVPMVDLTADFNEYRQKFQPFSETSGLDHMNKYGHLLTAFILADKLKREKILP